MRGESWDGFGRSASFLILLLLTQTCGSRFLYLITISPDCTLLGFLEHCFSYIFLDFFLFTFSFLQGFFLWFLLPIWFLFKFQSTYFLLFFFSHLFCPHFLCTFGLLDQAGRSYLPVMISGFVMRSCAYSNTHNCTKKKNTCFSFPPEVGIGVEVEVVSLPVGRIWNHQSQWGYGARKVTFLLALRRLVGCGGTGSLS